jgi:hypothetical protein
LPVTFKSLRLPVLIALLVIGSSVLLAWLNEQNSDEKGHPSSYSTRKMGGKAAYLLLLQSGYPVERWAQPPEKLPAKSAGTTLVLAEPEEMISAENGKALESFVRAGGRLLVTGGSLPLGNLPESVDDGATRVGYAECKPAAPTFLTRAGAVTQDGDLHWSEAGSNQVVHYRDDKGNAVVISYRFGEGEVIWWASPLPLTNIGIRDKGNLDLLLYSVGSGRKILWDEYFHTPQHAAEKVKQYAMILRWAKWQLLLLGAVLLFAYARRSTPVVPLARPSRLSPLEFVQTMGSVFHKADARLAPLEIAFARLQQLAARRLSLPPNAKATEMVEAMQRRGYNVGDELARELREAEDALGNPDLKEATAVQHAGAIHRALAILEREHKGNV